MLYFYNDYGVIHIYIDLNTHIINVFHAFLSWIDTEFIIYGI